MMKYFVFYVWIMIAGILLAEAVNQLAERCGSPVKDVDAALIVSAIAWPVIIVATVFLDDGALAKSECKP